MRTLLLACGLTVVTAEALFQRLEDPFIPTLLAAALLMSLACWRSRGGARVVAANLATIALVLLGFELWVIAREPASANRSDHTGTYVDGYFLPRSPNGDSGRRPIAPPRAARSSTGK